MEKSNNSTSIIIIFKISKFWNIGLHLVVPNFDPHPRKFGRSKFECSLISKFEISAILKFHCSKF